MSFSSDRYSRRSDVRTIPSGGVVGGTVAPPPSKSFSHRYFVLALLANAKLTVERPLDAEDTRLFMALLEAVGFGVERDGEAVHLQPPDPGAKPGVRPVDLFCGNAGTLLRLVTAALATRPGRWRIDGTARMRERPIGPLLTALRSLGVRIEEVGVSGHPPVIVHGGKLAGGEIEVDAGESSQYLSALLLAALAAEGPSRITATALTSSPYVDLTLAAAGAFGGVIEREAESGGGDVFHVQPGLAPPSTVTVEGDWSAAAYPAAAAALTGGSVVLAGMHADSAQGDRKFLDLLGRMGAQVRVEAGAEGDEITVAGTGPLRALDVDMATMPDQVPTMAALAPFARGTTRIRGVPHLRIKESDRLAAMATEVGRAGAHAVETGDGLVLEGVWADAEPPSTPVIAESWSDHRIAMSMALVGLRRPGLTVADPGVVAKSYPNFWRDLDRLLLAGQAAR